MHVRIQLYVPAALPREDGGTHSTLFCKDNTYMTEWNVVLCYIIAQKLTDGLMCVWSVENNARVCHVITHALWLIRVTCCLPSRLLLRATQICLGVCHQWDINPCLGFRLKNVIDVVKVHRALYQSGHGMAQVSGPWWCKGVEPSPSLLTQLEHEPHFPYTWRLSSSFTHSTSLQSN